MGARLGQVVDGLTIGCLLPGPPIERPGATTLQWSSLTLIGPEFKTENMAPDFEGVDAGLKPVNLSATGSKIRIFRVLP